MLEFDRKITHSQHNPPYNFVTDSEGKTICDSDNSDLRIIEEDHDENGATYWDGGTEKIMKEMVRRYNLHDQIINTINNYYCICDNTNNCLRCKIRLLIQDEQNR